MDSGERANSGSYGDNANSVREQAARRLSMQSRTSAGAEALEVVADPFDEQARKLRPSSVKK